LSSGFVECHVLEEELLHERVDRLEDRLERIEKFLRKKFLEEWEAFEE